jgi:hypothetical protein
VPVPRRLVPTRQRLRHSRGRVPRIASTRTPPFRAEQCYDATGNPGFSSLEWVIDEVVPSSYQGLHYYLARIAISQMTPGNSGTYVMSSWSHANYCANDVASLGTHISDELPER